MSAFCYIPVFLGTSVTAGLAAFPPIFCAMFMNGVDRDLGNDNENETCIKSMLIGFVIGNIVISHALASSYCSDVHESPNSKNGCPDKTLPKYTYYESGAIKSIECMGSESSAENGEL